VRRPSLWGRGFDSSSTKRCHIVESPWLPGGDEVTPTMKLKRKAIDLKYAATIDALYADKE
jgi:long-chain acyl-CoA synthetase